MSFFEKSFDLNDLKPKNISVTLQELIDRKKSFVLVQGKLYRVTVEEIDKEKLNAIDDRPNPKR